MSLAHPSHGVVALACVVAAAAYTFLAVPIRRRFQARGLLVLNAFAVVALSVAVTTMEPFVGEFQEVRQLPIMGSLAGVTLSSVVIHRAISNSVDPDPLVEIALGIGAFLGGFIAGILLAGTTVLVIA